MEIIAILATIFTLNAVECRDYYYYTTITIEELEVMGCSVDGLADEIYKDLFSDLK